MPFHLSTSRRRAFLQSSALAIAGAVWARGPDSMAAEEKPSLFSAIGLAAPLSRAAFLKSRGAAFITEGTGRFLMPDKDDAAFAKNLELLKASPLPVMACNGFLAAPDLRCIGPTANPDAVLAWADIALDRLRKAGGSLMVFGSSVARRLPDGWTRAKADDQFVTLLKKLGAIAEKYKVTIVLEQLQPSECNFINHIGRAAQIIRLVNHPHVRLLADLFHMSRVNDRPADLAAAMDVVVHMEIAERRERTIPGVDGDDFRPFFRVLREAGYKKAINMEGKWDDQQVGPAIIEIRKQAAEV